MNGLAKYAAMLPLVAGCADPSGHVCTLIGCDSGARFELGAFPESKFARLTGARVEVCLLGTCRDRVIDALPPPNDITYLSLGAPGDPRVEVSLWRTDPSGAIEIEVVVASGQFELFRDGDVYTVALVGSDGIPLANRSWSVNYRTWQPNGPDCEPTCRSATSTTEL